jgi:hypothetical protein
MIWQNCVVCGKSVDVDNCFGTIDSSHTFCDEHDGIRIVFDKINQFRSEIFNLKYQFDEMYKLLRSNICIAEHLGQMKASHDEEQTKDD